MVSTLIKNGRIVTAVDEYTADILIEDDRVRMIGRDLPAADHTQVHDARCLLVLPGGVDVHTHLDWDFGVARTVDTFGTGTKAAAFGVVYLRVIGRGEISPDHTHAVVLDEIGRASCRERL